MLREQLDPSSDIYPISTVGRGIYPRTEVDMNNQNEAILSIAPGLLTQVIDTSLQAGENLEIKYDMTPNQSVSTVILTVDKDHRASIYTPQFVANESSGTEAVSRIECEDDCQIFILNGNMANAQHDIKFTKS